MRTAEESVWFRGRWREGDIKSRAIEERNESKQSERDQ